MSIEMRPWGARFESFHMDENSPGMKAYCRICGECIITRIFTDAALLPDNLKVELALRASAEDKAIFWKHLADAHGDVLDA